MPDPNVIDPNEEMANPADTQAVESGPLTVRGGQVEKIMEDVGHDSDMQMPEEYPDAPAEGFANREEYERFIGKMNSKAVKDFAEFKAHPEIYRTRDPENPDKYVKTVVHTCADGRCNPALYTEKSLEHLNIDWQPAAGLIYFPEIMVPVTCDEIKERLASNPKLREKIFHRLDQMYGPSIREFFAEHKDGISSRFFIEFQAHYDSAHYPKHGCGAHKSNLANAQKETIKNAVVAEEWLKERNLEAFNNGILRVSRTVQDNSEKGNVYEGAHIDGTLTADEKGEFAGLFEEVRDKFKPPVISDKDDHVVRPYCGNPFGIDTAEHSEQGVRVSMFQWANTLNGQSAMEIIWTNDSKILMGHIKVLLGIIGDNKFSGANPDKPHYVHLDMVKGDFVTRSVCRELREAMDKDQSIASRLDDGSLFLVVTETDRETMKSEAVNV